MRKAKSSKKVDFSKTAKLFSLIEHWRSIIGVDPIYIIDLKIGIPDVEGLISTPAWVEGLDSSNQHPTATIFFNGIWLEEKKFDEYWILETVIHELCHIVIFDSLIMADPTYKYEGMRARASEILTMKMTNAILSQVNLKN